MSLRSCGEDRGPSPYALPAFDAAPPGPVPVSTVPLRGQPRGRLSRRETQVLDLLAHGCSNREIAERMIVSKDTVKYHLKNLYSKLGSKRRTEALLTALQLGLMPVRQ
jgi:ATP/maltotriose-dependent transcriptional regulator MalT